MTTADAATDSGRRSSRRIDRLGTGTRRTPSASARRASSAADGRSRCSGGRPRALHLSRRRFLRRRRRLQLPVWHGVATVIPNSIGILRRGAPQQLFLLRHGSDRCRSPSWHRGDASRGSSPRSEPGQATSTKAAVTFRTSGRTKSSVGKAKTHDKPHALSQILGIS